MSELESTVVQSFMIEVREDLKAVRSDIESINRLLIELGKLEVEHRATRESLGRAFTSVDKMSEKHDELNKRVVEIEKVMPGLRETRVWIIGAVIGCVSLVLISVFANNAFRPQYITVPTTQSK